MSSASRGVRPKNSASESGDVFQERPAPVDLAQDRRVVRTEALVELPPLRRYIGNRIPAAEQEFPEASRRVDTCRETTADANDRDRFRGGIRLWWLRDITSWYGSRHSAGGRRER